MISDLLIHKERLLRARIELLERLAQKHAGANSRLSMAAPDVLRVFKNIPQTASERAEAFGMSALETAELSALDAALERLQAGHYGICKDCGSPIPQDRLDASPTALRCKDCQAITEQRH